MFFYSKEQVLDKNSYLLIKNYSNLISAYSLPMYLQHAKATLLSAYRPVIGATTKSEYYRALLIHGLDFFITIIYLNSFVLACTNPASIHKIKAIQ